MVPEEVKMRRGSLIRDTSDDIGRLVVPCDMMVAVLFGLQFLSVPVRLWTRGGEVSQGRPDHDGDVVH